MAEGLSVEELESLSSDDGVPPAEQLDEEAIQHMLDL